MTTQKSKTKRPTALKVVPKLAMASVRLADPDNEPQFHEHVSGVIIEGLPKPGPCPFCHKIEFGGIATCGKVGDEDTTYHVQCDSCGAEGPPESSQRAAALGWNAVTAQNAAPIDLKPLANRLLTALNARERAETSVIVSTLALEGQRADFDNRIAESLKASAWDGLADVYIALHQAMHLIPEDDRPNGFQPDTGVSLNEMPDDPLAKLVERLNPIERMAIRTGITQQLGSCKTDEEYDAVKGLYNALEVAHG